MFHKRNVLTWGPQAPGGPGWPSSPSSPSLPGAPTRPGLPLSPHLPYETKQLITEPCSNKMLFISLLMTGNDKKKTRYLETWTKNWPSKTKWVWNQIHLVKSLHTLWGNYYYITLLMKCLHCENTDSLHHSAEPLHWQGITFMATQCLEDCGWTTCAVDVAFLDFFLS